MEPDNARAGMHIAQHSQRIEQADGKTHGKWALTAQNVANATRERLQDEMEQYAKARGGGGPAGTIGEAQRGGRTTEDRGRLGDRKMLKQC